MNLKNISAVFLILSALLFFVSCSEDNENKDQEQITITEADMLGCWKVELETINGEDNPKIGEEAYLEFKENNIVVFSDENGYDEEGWGINSEGTAFTLEDADAWYSISKFENGILEATLIEIDDDTGDEYTYFMRLSKASDCPEIEIITFENQMTATISGLIQHEFEDAFMTITEDNDGIIVEGVGQTWGIPIITILFDLNWEEGIYTYDDNAEFDPTFTLRFQGKDSQYYGNSESQIEILVNNEDGIKANFNFKAEDLDNNKIDITNGYFEFEK
jgi:hypothetical protein